MKISIFLVEKGAYGLKVFLTNWDRSNISPQYICIIKSVLIFGDHHHKSHIKHHNIITSNTVYTSTMKSTHWDEDLKYGNYNNLEDDQRFSKGRKIFDTSYKIFYEWIPKLYWCYFNSFV